MGNDDDCRNGGYAMSRWNPKSYHERAQLGIGAGNEEPVAPDVRQRDANAKALFEARKEVADDSMRFDQLRQTLRNLVVLWENEADEYERAGSYEIAYHYRGCGGAIRAALKGHRLDSKRGFMGVRDARWSK